MARFEIYTPEETKKEDRLQCFYRWICIPFCRRSHSYIEPIHKVVSSPTPPIEMIHLRPDHPLEDPSSSLYQTHENKILVHQKQEPEETHQPRCRYRETRPQHPASHIMCQRNPPTCTEQVVSEQRSSVLVMREEVCFALNRRLSRRSFSRAMSEGIVPAVVCWIILQMLQPVTI
jgi:hypothetical protein